MNDKEREDNTDNLDKLLISNVEKPYKKRLTNFFNQLVTKIADKVHLLLKGQPLFLPGSIQKELGNILEGYTVKTSDLVTKESKKELINDLKRTEIDKKKDLVTKRQKIRETVNKLADSGKLPDNIARDLKDVNKIVPKDKLGQLLTDRQSQSLDTLQNEVKQNVKDIKKIREAISRVKQSKITTLNNTEKDYMRQLSGKELIDLQAQVRNDLMKALNDNPELTVREAKKIVLDSGKAFNDVRLETILRTEGTKIANQRRLELFSQSKITQGVEFIATIDNRTTIHICLPRHKAQFKLGTVELAMNTPPLHFRCRSILSPVTIFEEFNPVSDDDMKDWAKPWSPPPKKNKS